MILSDKIALHIKNHALQNINEECCGLLIEKDGETVAFSSLNTHHDKKNHYQISARSYIEASKLGKIIGDYHSHPYGESDGFSFLDKINAQGHDLIKVLYLHNKDKFYIYEPLKQKKYLGREFKIGVNDCFSLVVDYYEQELNIKINDPFADRKDDDFFEKKSKEIYSNLSQIAADQGFQFLKDYTLQRNDVLLISVKNEKFPSHFAIYLGNNTILHQTRNSKSVISPLDEEQIERISGIFRKI